MFTDRETYRLVNIIEYGRMAQLVEPTGKIIKLNMVAWLSW